MALVYCRECGKKISTQAVQCPACGSPAPKSKKRIVWNKNNIVLYILISFTLFFLTGALAEAMSREMILKPAWDARDAARDLDEARREAEAAKTYFSFVRPPPPYGTFEKAHAPIFGYEFWQHWFPIAFGIITGVFGGYKITMKIAGRKIDS